MPDDPCAVDDRDGSHTRDPYACRLEDRQPLGVGRVGAADPTTMYDELTDRRIARGEGLPEVAGEDPREVFGPAIAGFEDLLAPDPEVCAAKRDERAEDERDGQSCRQLPLPN